MNRDMGLSYRKVSEKSGCMRLDSDIFTAVER